MKENLLMLTPFLSLSSFQCPPKSVTPLFTRQRVTLGYPQLFTIGSTMLDLCLHSHIHLDLRLDFKMFSHHSMLPFHWFSDEV